MNGRYFTTLFRIAEKPSQTSSPRGLFLLLVMRRSLRPERADPAPDSSGSDIRDRIPARSHRFLSVYTDTY